MSCENLVKKLDQLANELPERAADEFYAVQGSIYLKKACPDRPSSHSAALAKAEGIHLTAAEKRRLKKEDFDYWKQFAFRLLFRHGKIRII